MISKIPRAVFDAIVILGGRLGIKMRDPARFASIGRKIMGKLIRFARLNPGLSIVSMLLNFGLSVDLANQLINWYATSGKKRRRLRVTNVKALNRSVRRLEGFHKLSVRVNAALSNRPASRSMPRRRCTKCRKNPCGC